MDILSSVRVPRTRPMIVPSYLLREKTSPYITTYGSMNDWMGVQNRVLSTGVPVTVSDASWRRSNTMADVRPGFNDKYGKAYTELSQQIAYRHPNPGKARERQGRIGGSWRHIKEVLGHGGSRVVFVDGLVGTYDTDKFTDELHGETYARPHLQGEGYVPAKYDSVNLTTQFPQYDPNDPSKLPSIPDAMPRSTYGDEDVDRKMALLDSETYKGFYKYK